MKFLKKSVWCMVGIFFMLLSMIFFIGGKVANQYDSYINEFFGTQNFKIIPSEEGELFNDYPSDYLNEDGSFNDKAMRDNSLRVAKEVATEGSVLLQNKENALPLKENSKISFFGISSNKYLFSGAGSGHLGVSVTSNLSEACAEVGLKVNPTLANAYKILASKYGSFLTESGTTISGTSIVDKCYVEYGINEVPWNELNKTTIGNVSSSFEQYSDAAFFIISRNDGEDGDTNYYTPECIDGCYLDLAHREIEILDQLMEFKKNGVFKKVVLLINSANPMQMKHIQTYDLDAIVWLGIGGNVAYQQIADLISGKANPSGRLIDTYLYDNYSSPSSVNLGDFTFAHSDGLPAREQYTHNNKYIVYQEGIYVGYRYFETRYEDLVLQQGNASSKKGSLDGEKWSYEKNVAYPFGYGQSYTTFQQDRFRVEESSNGYQVKVRVTNTGTLPGKDVVQVYLQKPYTDYDKEHKIEKASVELVGFAKTKLLQPKESEEISIFVEKDALKSYDAYGYRTYIVEDGDYYLAIGQNAHDALNAILAKKGKTTADGMDQEGNEKQAYSFHLSRFNKDSYSLSKTGYPITNQFDDADPTLYEGTKDQFSDFHYLSRSDYDRTYPTKVVMDCITQRMKDDLQYVGKIEEDETLSLPTFGQKGEHSLMEMYGLSYDDKAWEALLNQVSWEEAVTLITYGGGTGGVVSVNAPNGLAKDGPGGIGQGNPNLPNIMCFPCECLMAATFNRDLIEDLGNAFGMEILHVGYTGIYGPGANIHRSPFSGRNWEYYSEDGYLSGQMLAREWSG